LFSVIGAIGVTGTSVPFSGTVDAGMGTGDTGDIGTTGATVGTCPITSGTGTARAKQSSVVSFARFAALVEQSIFAAAVKLCMRAKLRAVSRESHPLSIFPPPSAAPKKGEDAPAEKLLKHGAVGNESGA
jgi:hypothetical protein